MVVFTLIVTWVHVEMAIVLSNLHVNFPVPSSTMDLVQSIRKTPVPFGFLWIYWNAFPEELVFRLFPLGLCLASKENRKFLPIAAIVGSFLFGWAHGSLLNVCIQGVAGIVYCILFVMIGHEGDEVALVKATLTTTLCHAFWNTIAIYFA